MLVAGLKRCLGFAVFGALLTFSAYAQGPITIGDSWQNLAVQNNTGTFTAEFDVTPSASPLDGVIGLSDGSVSAYASLAAIVRFNDSGFIDARNAGSYDADVELPYAAGSTYHFRLEINVSSRTYSIYVTPAGATEQLIGDAYRFRSEQSAVTRLNNFAGLSEGGSVQVSGLTVSGGGTPNQPPTVQIVSPAAGSSAIAPATFEISANASDTDGTVARVDFFDGDNLLGSDSSAPFSFTWANVPVGSFTLTARATDNSGATATSEAINVTVSPAPVASASIQLAWDPSSSPDVVAYRVHVGTTPGGYSRSIRVGNVTSYTVTELEPGETYHFAVTAISWNELESDYSNPVSASLEEVSRPVLRGSMVGGAFQIVSDSPVTRTYIVDQSSDLREWTVLTTLIPDLEGRLSFTNQPVGPQRFFRIREL